MLTLYVFLNFNFLGIRIINVQIFFRLVISILPISFFLTNSSIAEELNVVVTAHPLATKAGKLILKSGGNAIDAAVAVQSTLSLVEPQSSGLGGGGFLMFFSSKDKKLYSLDGREVAPKRAKPDTFSKFTGSRDAFYKAVISPLSVGVPGIPLLLEEAHNKFGSLPWQRLFEYPISLARDGFKISPRLHSLISRDKFLNLNKTSGRYFFNNINNKLVPKKIGAVLKNKAYQRFLEIIAKKKPSDVFYNGIITREILKDLKESSSETLLEMADFKAYTVKVRDPICGYYRKYKVCSMGPPSSGGIALIQILGIIQEFKTTLLKNSPVNTVHLLSEATKVAFADRSVYVGDPDFVDVPIEKLLKKEYLRKRAKKISIQHANPQVLPATFEKNRSKNIDISLPSTSHFVIYDRFGNAVSMTSSVESAFGSRIMSSGMLMNNQLTDFSFKPDGVNRNYLANSVEPGKRPMSSMTPTIIFDSENRLYALLGSPGGKAIISFVAQSIIHLIDWELSLQESINYPRAVTINQRLILEKGPILDNLINPLKEKGHRKIFSRPIFSGIHGIKFLRKGDNLEFEVGIDPRREGTAEIFPTAKNHAKISHY